MRKIIALSLLITSFLSCSIDDDQPNFHFEFTAIDSVSMPDSFIFGEIYTIEYSYFKPTTCHYFNDLYYEANGNTRTVAVVEKVINDSSNNPCTELTDQLKTNSFQFHVVRNEGTYIFRFWQGLDENEDDIYLIYEIPIE